MNNVAMRATKLALVAGILGMVTVVAGATAVARGGKTEQLRSPDGRIVVSFELKDGRPHYQVDVDGGTAIKPSRLGLLLQGQDALGSKLEVKAVSRGSADRRWEQAWGEQRYVREQYRELRVEMAESQGKHRKLAIVFRAFNDGVGFRYDVPEQGLGAVNILEEETEFGVSDDAQVWWTPAYQKQSYEYLYTKSRLSDISGAVFGPLTMQLPSGIYLSLNEADLRDYGSMVFKRGFEGGLRADIVPWSDGVRVKTRDPFKSPWRVIHIARKPGDLLTSTIVLNLNEPNALPQASWVTPGKYVGIWWKMHRALWTWGSGPQHGATTAHMKQHIDFAAKHKFLGVLVEGWNEGWDGDWFVNRDKFRFSKAYPDFDLQELAAYAKHKGVKLILQNETAGGVPNYEDQIEAAYSLYGGLGVGGVKTGYVSFGQDVDHRSKSGEMTKEWHEGQFMVNHVRRTIELAAANKMMVVTHEPVLLPGLSRTYPNFMSQEAARGQEYNGWSQDGGNPPDHVTIVPFTRSLATPFDYTAGIFDLLYENSQKPAVSSNLDKAETANDIEANKVKNRVNGTLAKELALYVTIFSPLQMAADFPENYEGHPAFKFIVDVPTTWQQTKVLNAEIGEHLTVARQDRCSDDWYVGAITNESPRNFDIRLDFLTPGRIYEAEVYEDGADADWRTNPKSYGIRKLNVKAGDRLAVKLAPGGGQAIRLRSLQPSKAACGKT